MANANSAQQQNPSIVERISRYLDIGYPFFFFLLVVSFYLRTYDSAQVKITEVQMFGTILIAFWFCKVFESGHWPFSKSQSLIVLPVALFFVSGVVSFIRSPLHWGSFDFFVRRVIYIGLAMIAMTELTSLKDYRRLTKWLVIALAVCTIYGLVQWLDINFFPAGPPTVGLDKFVWRKAFGERVFSTFGNPNFYSNFLVAMVPIMMALYFMKRQFYYLPLIALTLINVYWSGSKGPFVGLLAGTAVFSFLVVRFFVKSRRVKLYVFSSAGIAGALMASYVIYRVFFGGAITSFSFRMYTWLSTWEMVNAKPVLGNGIGTFWVLYPAYRRPAIFHIESKHNTETDHAENEHLEVWMDEGIVGAGIWFWLIGMISYGIYRAMAVLTASQPTRAGPSGEDDQFPEEVYYMLGFVSGFLGMLIHNFTDVSMRFVSSGAPFWMLTGVCAALIMYSPLPMDHLPPASIKEEEPGAVRAWALKAARLVVMAAIVIVAVRIIRQFDWCQGRDGAQNPNEAPHFFITWAFFLLCWGASAWWFLQTALRCRQLKSLAILLIATVLLVPFWGFFVGDVDHNRAIFFSKQGVWTRSPEFDARMAGFPPEYQVMYGGGEPGTIDRDTAFGRFVDFLFPDIFWRRYGIGGALDHYAEVNRLRPDFIMAHYFRGNVFNDWGSQFAAKTQQAFQQGDVAQAEVFRKKTDELWNKAMEAYAATRRLGPNYVQMHHQVGTVHQKWGDFLNSLAPMAEKYGHKELAAQYRKEARDHWLKALDSYRLYYKIDPVFDQNFYRQAQVYIQLGELDKAEQTYIDFIQAKECKKPVHQIFDGFYVKTVGSPENRYDLASAYHTHDIVNVSKPEAWMYLGDFYSFVKPNPFRAEECYLKAVKLHPDNIDFLKHLASFYQRTGRLRESTELWKKVYALNPQDPDVQKLIRAQPRPK